MGTLHCTFEKNVGGMLRKENVYREFLVVWQFFLWQSSCGFSARLPFCLWKTKFQETSECCSYPGKSGAQGDRSVAL